MYLKQSTRIVQQKAATRNNNTFQTSSSNINNIETKNKKKADEKTRKKTTFQVEIVELMDFFFARATILCAIVVNLLVSGQLYEE